MHCQDNNDPFIDDCGCGGRNDKCCNNDPCLRPCFRRTESATELHGIQVNLTGGGGSAIVNGANVIFNNIVTDATRTITYNTANGEFVLRKQGAYLINWWIATDNAPDDGISFAIRHSNGTDITASTPIDKGQLNGIALVTVKNSPSLVRLVNVTGANVTLANTPVQASITVTYAV